MKLPHLTSLRAKLLVAAIAVQALMLVALTAQSVKFLDTKLEERAQVRLDEEKSLLASALAGPLKRRDGAAIESILSRARSNEGVAYLMLFDSAGTLIAKSGWD